MKANENSGRSICTFQIGCDAKNLVVKLSKKEAIAKAKAITCLEGMNVTLVSVSTVCMLFPCQRYACCL